MKRRQEGGRVVTAREATESGPSSPSCSSSAPSPEEERGEEEPKSLASPHESLVAGCKVLFTGLFLEVVARRLLATPR